MKIGILGAGAMGCMLGTFLSRAGAEVWLISRNEANMSAVREKGVIFEINGESLVAQTHAVTRAKEAGVCDVVLVLTKCPDTRSAIAGAAELFGPDTYVLSLQNGLGNETVLLEFFDRAHVCYGAVNAGATTLSPGHIRIKGQAKLSEAIFFRCLADERPAVCGELAELFTNGGIGAAYAENIDELIWRKATINVADSFLFAICQTNGEAMADMPETMRLRERIIREMADVAAARGISFDFESCWHEYEFVMAPVLQDKYPSAVMDVYRRKRTEIEFMNGFISREGRRLGVPTPINDAISVIARILEHTYENRYSE